MESKNGATRRHLKVINRGNFEGNSFRASIGTLNKGNHSFIFLNPERGQDNRVVGLFLNSDYGYTVIKEHSPENPILFENYSSGGYGNSCSIFGLYKVGTVLAEHSYKHRRGDTYYKLTEQGWKCLGKDVPLTKEEIQII